jgi:hypothetical protein
MLAGMAVIAFTSHLRRVAPAAPTTVAAATVGEALGAVCADYPLLRSYVLDDQGAIRKHIAVFVDGAMKPRETALGLPVGDDTEVYVFQALSGG